MAFPSAWQLDRLSQISAPACSALSAAERSSSHSWIWNQRISSAAEWLCVAQLSHTLSLRVRRRQSAV